LLTTEKEYQIIEAVENNVDLEITELDVVTEASILYRLEKKYFDIPFNLGNNFFTNTKEIKEYIDHFPAYLKKPNNIFQKYFKFYQR
jgi:pyridoxal biosynthesis lyase PdxS